MDRLELDALLTSEALTLLDTVASADDVVRSVTKLRSQGHSPAVVSAVLGQVALRRKAADKFGPFAATMLFSASGLEMATRLTVGSHHAGRFVSAGIKSVADIGCGIGGDSLAFAGAGLRVTAIDSDPVTAALAAYNLQPFPDVTVVHGGLDNVPWDTVEGLWFDPARRTGATRQSRPEEWSPSLDVVFQHAKTHPSGIKLAPGMDRDVIPEGMEAQWVSYKGSVVEMVLWSGSLTRPGVTRSALVLHDGRAVEFTGPADSPDAPVGDLREYVIEPDGAVIRARLIGDLARTHDAHMVDSSIAYMTASQPAHSPLAQSFRVLETTPFTLKNVKTLVAAAQLGTLEIKKRGVDINPAQLRTQLPLKGSGSGVLIVTRLHGQKTAILAERVTSEV